MVGGAAGFGPRFRHNFRLTPERLATAVEEGERIKCSDLMYTIRRFYPWPRPTQHSQKPASVLQEWRHASDLSKAVRLGIHPRTLYALRDAGDIEQVCRGLYRLSTAPPLSSPDLVPIAIRIPRAVTCLISALAHHGLTTQVPHAVDIALPSHAQVPKVDSVPIRVFWYPEPSFRACVNLITVDDVPVKIYSPEKTIADCFKYRNKIGLDIAIEALRAYRERPRKPNRAALTEFAQINRVQKVMRPYLEAVM
jgi:predicted transcriptional regulator of viral defense system